MIRIKKLYLMHLLIFLYNIFKREQKNTIYLIRFCLSMTEEDRKQTNNAGSVNLLSKKNYLLLYFLL